MIAPTLVTLIPAQVGQQSIGISQYLFLLTTALGIGSAALTGVIAHIKAPSQVKAVILLSLSLVSGAIEQGVQASGKFTWHGFLTATVLAFTAGVIAHKGALLDFLTGPNGLVANYLPAGIGAPVDTVIDNATGGHTGALTVKTDSVFIQRPGDSAPEVVGPVGVSPEQVLPVTPADPA